jgi:hypothetical protein
MITLLTCKRVSNGEQRKRAAECKKVEQGLDLLSLCGTKCRAFVACNVPVRLHVRSPLPLSRYLARKGGRLYGRERDGYVCAAVTNAQYNTGKETYLKNHPAELCSEQKLLPLGNQGIDDEGFLHVCESGLLAWVLQVVPATIVVNDVRLYDNSKEKPL